MKQLTFFPERGFGLLLPGGDLAHDLYSQQPYFVRTRRTAKRQAAKVAASWIGYAEVARVEIHPPVDGNGRPIYIVLPRRAA